MKQMIAPNGRYIVGTKELVPACANTNGFSDLGDPIYAGGSEMYWDDSKTQYHEGRDGNGNMIVIDECGDEHVASDCKLVDE
jgi:hypothetical protein